MNLAHIGIALAFGAGLGFASGACTAHGAARRLCRDAGYASGSFQIDGRGIVCRPHAMVPPDVVVPIPQVSK